MNKICWIGLLCFLTSSLLAQSAADYLQQGEAAYAKKDFRAAEEAYRFALQESKSPLVEYNLANTLFQQTRFSEAIATYEQALAGAPSSELAAMIHHNIGQAQYQEGSYAKAIAAFRQSLRLNPGDYDTQYNLSMALMALEDQQQSEQEEQDEKGDGQATAEEPQAESPSNSNQEPQEDNTGDPSEGGSAVAPGTQSNDANEGESTQGQSANAQQQSLNEQQARKLLEAIENEEARAQQRYRRGKGGTCYSKKRY